MFRSSAETSKAKLFFMGCSAQRDVRAENVESRGAQGSAFDVVAGGGRERACLPLVGAHNIQMHWPPLRVALDRGISLS